MDWVEVTFVDMYMYVCVIFLRVLFPLFVSLHLFEGRMLHVMAVCCFDFSFLFFSILILTFDFLFYPYVIHYYTMTVRLYTYLPFVYNFLN